MYQNARSRLREQIPTRSASAARGAAIGAGVGSLFGRKEAVGLAAAGAYVGMRVGERKEMNAVVTDDEDVEQEPRFAKATARFRDLRNAEEDEEEATE